MDDRGYVRSYQRRSKKKKKLNKGPIILIIVLCIIIMILTVILILKWTNKFPVNKDGDNAFSTTEKIISPDDTTTIQNSDIDNTKIDSTLSNETTAPQNSEVTEDITTEPVKKEVPMILTDEFVNGAVKIKIKEDTWMLTLVNKYYALDSSFKPEGPVEISGGENATNGNGKLDSRAAVYFEKMYAQCLKDTGVVLNTVSAYRSYDYQVNLYNKQVDREISRGLSEDEAKVKAATIVAYPGTSEHTLGLATDIGRITEDFENSKGYKWLNEHAHEYGFILRYPKGKEDITQVIYEPWHWRFVGVEAAKEMKEKNQTLEEYLGLIGPSEKANY